MNWRAEPANTPLVEQAREGQWSTTQWRLCLTSAFLVTLVGPKLCCKLQPTSEHRKRARRVRRKEWGWKPISGVVAQVKPHLGCLRRALHRLRVQAVRTPEADFLRAGGLHAGKAMAGLGR